MLVNNLLAAKFFMIFSPLFMTYSLSLPKFIRNHSVGYIVQDGHNFTKSRFFTFIIRPCYLQYLVNIYLIIFSLSSQVFYYFSCGSANTLLGWGFGMTLFGLGVFYLGLHFCRGNAYSQQMYDRLHQ